MSHLTELIRRMQEGRGKALHVTAGQAPRMRIRDRLQKVEDLVLTSDELEAEVKALAGKQTWAKCLGGEADDFLCEIAGERYRARLFPSHTGPMLVLRSTAEMSSFKHLGLPRTVSRLAHLRRGFVIVAGPTGSGKSTTMGAFLSEIEAGRPKHVVTIESPIELTYVRKKTTISPREVGDHTTSFAAGLRAALRQSPDVIFASDLPDAESVGLALQAAAAGALMVVTVRASGVVRALEHYLELAPDRRRATLNALSEHLSAGVSLLRLQRADGTGHCVAAEILVRSRGVVGALRDDALESIHETMRRAENMQTMDDALAQLVKAKRIALEDAFDHARDKQRFKGHRGARRVMRNTRFMS